MAPLTEYQKAFLKNVLVSKDNIIDPDTGEPWNPSDPQVASDVDDLKVGAFELAIDGGGAPVTTGVKYDVSVPFDCDISEVRILADQAGSIVFDLWKDSEGNYPPTVADSICASAKPTLSNATHGTDETLTGWSKSLTEGDAVRVNIDSAAVLQRVTLILKYRRT